MSLLDFDFDTLFDESTIRVKKENVNVELILRKREENRKARDEAQKAREELNDEADKDEHVPHENPGKEDTGGPPEKKSRRKEGKRGQNKNRGQHFEVRLDDKEKICRSYMKGECGFGDNCKFSHDEKSVYSKRKADIGSLVGMICPTFDTYGFCHYGISCRFSDTHIEVKEDGSLENKKHESKPHKMVDEFEGNRVNGPFLSMLRSCRFPFSKTKAALLELPKKNQPPTMKKSIREGNKGFYKPDEIPKEIYSPKLGSLADGEKKVIEFRGKSYLAPLTTVGNLPFRRVCKDYGVDITCGEMATSKNLLQGKMSEWALCQRHESEDFFGVQIAGAWPDELAKVAELLGEFSQIDFIDINCGCPLDLICNHGGGCRLGKSPDRLASAITTMRKASGVPVTCKIRTGWKPDDDFAHKLIAKLQESKPALITLHGRSRICRYTGRARWDYIQTCAKVSNDVAIPFFGNGDVLNYSDYQNAIDEYGTDGAMIGRGALIKPWIFEEIKENKVMDPSSSQRLDMLKKFCRYGLEHWGSDQQGVANTRRFLLEWISFLCRYVPTGIIEGQPQRINHRPPPLVCRDELETLMTSADCNNWIKITEMLLGPVPESFRFMPKHKASSYKN